MIKPRKTFHFKPPNQIKEDSMDGLTSMGVHNSIFNITEQNNKLELQKNPDSKNGSISYEKVRDEIERDLEITDNTATVLQDDIIGPNIIG